MLLIGAFGGCAETVATGTAKREAPRPKPQRLPALFITEKPDGGVRAQIRSDVFFRLDQAALRPAGVVAIRRDLLERARRTTAGGGTVVIDGYTDGLGTAAHNHELSGARADAVAELLIAGGVERDSIVVHGYGERAAADERAAPSLRRVEIALIPAEG